MFKTSRPRNEDLDLIGKVILRSAAAQEEDVEAAASSPFLFTRVRAAIAAEQRLQEESGSWLSLILVARRSAGHRPRLTKRVFPFCSSPVLSKQYSPVEGCRATTYSTSSWTVIMR